MRLKKMMNDKSIVYQSAYCNKLPEFALLLLLLLGTGGGGICCCC